MKASGSGILCLRILQCIIKSSRLSAVYLFLLTIWQTGWLSHPRFSSSFNTLWIARTASIARNPLGKRGGIGCRGCRKHRRKHRCQWRNRRRTQGLCHHSSHCWRRPCELRHLSCQHVQLSCRRKWHRWHRQVQSTLGAQRELSCMPLLTCRNFETVACTNWNLKSWCIEAFKFHQATWAAKAVQHGLPYRRRGWITLGRTATAP